jgi:copper chaperone NosL
MTVTRRRSFVSLALVALLAACASAPAGPPPVQWGVDECSHCHMILSDQRFAVVARAENGDEVRFDDLGCARSFFAGRATADGDRGWRTWIHEARGERWLEAEGAWIVRLSERTPMGSSLGAFADDGAARAAAAQGSLPVRWPALLADHSQQPTPGGMP